MAAQAGMIGLITADSGRSPKAVAPFGGREARLGTNPISIAMPSDLEGPLYLDMATSAAAAGKIALVVARGTPVPPGWIIDRDGRPTTDPSQLRQGGALLPVGGSEGLQGLLASSVMVEILCGLLTGLGFGVEPTGRHNDGCFMAVFKVDAFRPLAQFKKESASSCSYLKATKPAEGSSGVYYPGRNRAHARGGPPRRTASKSRTPPGTRSARWPRAMASTTSSGCRRLGGVALLWKHEALAPGVERVFVHAADQHIDVAAISGERQ